MAVAWYLLLGTSSVLYVSWLVVSRLFLSPLARFPGPRLAALSNWYEFYYDVILQGQFTAHIRELHEKYGPIIRITPTELHVNDPDFHEQLYSRTGRRDRSSYMAGRFGHSSDTFSTVGHDLHRFRRKSISPFFSAKRISEFEPVIRKNVDKFIRRLAEYSEGRVVTLSQGWMALTTDIITDYSFARSYNQLDSPDFQDTFNEALIAIYTTGQFALHFPVVFPILNILPDWLTLRMEPRLIPVVGLRKDLAREVGEIRHGRNDAHKSASHPTIFHDLLLNNDLPESEKTDARLGDEAQLIVAAGLITTSWALSVGSFHIINNPKVGQRLRDEVIAAQALQKEPLDWHQLEKLPYLNGCVHESIRLAHGVTTRQPRIAPDEEIQYGSWTIPRNTPVSMTSVHILMNENIFPNPREFIPERWINRPDLDRYFVPFGKGSRQCLGINLAHAELYISLAAVFTRVEFQLHETDVSDAEMKHAFLVPYAKWDSKGIRVKVKSVH